MDKQIIDIENVLQNWEHDVLSTLPKIILMESLYLSYFLF